MFIKTEIVVSNDIGEALCRTVTLYCNMSLKCFHTEAIPFDNI